MLYGVAHHIREKDKRRINITVTTTRITHSKSKLLRRADNKIKELIEEREIARLKKGHHMRKQTKNINT